MSTKCMHGLSTSPSCKDPDNICLTCISPAINEDKLRRTKMTDLKRAEELWSLLDEIDTIPDIIHPNDEKSHELCWKKMVNIAAKRHQILKTDGYKLRYPDD